MIDTICHQSTFIKKSLFVDYGLYNENYRIVSDWEKWIIFLLINKCTYKHINILATVFNMDGISSNNGELCMKEKEDVLHRYFTEEEIDFAKASICKKDTFTLVEQIFSIKNANDKQHKIITILGIHIKITRGNK